MHCDYCNEREGIKTIYNEIYGLKNRTVYETEHFIVFPCMGQLREGHLLIVSKKHINAIGMLNGNIIKELEELVLTVSEFYIKEYGGDVFCFEHGVINDSGTNGGCGIYHMHLHLIPIKGNEFNLILDKVKEQEGNKIYPHKRMIDTCQCIVDKHTYVYISQISNKQFREECIVTNNDNYFESQYMRKVVSDVFGNLEWDWRKIINEEPDFLKTLEKTRCFFGSTPRYCDIN